MRPSSYRQRAYREGVQRPFEVLASMTPGARVEIADILGCRLRTGSSPEAEAWSIINHDLKGLQARTHHLAEKMSPFARNNNWWEIVTRTASRMKIRFYPGIRDVDVEELIFEHASRAAMQRWRSDRTKLNAFATQNRSLIESLSYVLPPNVARFVLFACACRGAGSRHDERFSRALAWVSEHFVPPALTFSMAAGLRFLREGFREIVRFWRDSDAFGASSEGKLVAAIAAIYLFDLVQRELEGFALH
ncbi:MAG: hypothetical protein U1E76_08880 [Planctomycetota bacterium]